MRMRALVLAIFLGVVVLAVGVEGSTGELGTLASDGPAGPAASAPDDAYEGLFLVPRIAGMNRGDPVPVNTPAPPVTAHDEGAVLSGMKDQLNPLEIAAEASAQQHITPSPLGPSSGHNEAGPLVPEMPVNRDQEEQLGAFSAILRQRGIQFEIQPSLRQASRASYTSPSETCIDIIVNSQMNVVEFGDGTGSIEPWSNLYQQVCYSKNSERVWSPLYSFTINDGQCAEDVPDNSFIDYEGYTWDYDAFGQGFVAPTGLTDLDVTYMRKYANLDEYDTAGSSLWTLDSNGYLEEQIAAYSIGESPDGWSSRHWELDGPDLAQASGEPLALVFYIWGDRVAPFEQVWLDDAQVRVCYQRGVNLVYLPLAAKQYGTSSGPTCVPREPDSVNQMGKTALGATCGGSFSALDEKDYYDLNLATTASAQEAEEDISIRLRLFNLPNGTNWDAMIYQNSTGYPLACQIGTTGDSNKHKDCTLDSNKDYFVLVSRGPETAGGTYQMSVTRR